MLEYVFMQRALAAGIILAIALPLVGSSLVLRRTSLMGDALSHCSLAGVAGGLVAGVNPVIGALVACIIASLGMEAVRRRLPRHADVAIAVVSAAGAGLAGVLSSAKGNTAGLDSFLFGSIVAVSEEDLMLVAVISLVVVIGALVFRHEIFLICMDEDLARASGVRVTIAGVALAVAAGIIVSVASRIIGSLVVSSMLVLPLVGAMQVARGYRAALVVSACTAIASVAAGLTCSYYGAVKPGGAIVLVCLGLLALLAACGAVRKRLGR